MNKGLRNELQLIMERITRLEIWREGVRQTHVAREGRQYQVPHLRHKSMS